MRGNDIRDDAHVTLNRVTHQEHWNFKSTVVYWLIV